MAGTCSVPATGAALHRRAHQQRRAGARSPILRRADQRASWWRFERFSLRSTEETCDRTVFAE